MSPAPLDADPIGDTVQLSFVELCRVTRVPAPRVRVWIVEGVLQPVAGASPVDWRFAEDALRRARIAHALMRDLEVNEAGAALALDLMDEIDALKASLRRTGVGR